MEIIVFGVFMICATLLGYKMGKGEEIKLPSKKPGVIIRSDEEAAAHEAYLFNKHSKGIIPLKKDKTNG